MTELGVWDDYPSDLYAVGDIHGDWNILIHVLKDLAKVISIDNDTLKWNGSDKWLVFCGDLVDRYRKRPGVKFTVDDENNDVKIIKTLIELNKQAETFGGKIILLFGNHELLNFEGIYNYVSIKGNTEERKQQFKRGSEFSLLLSKNVYLSAKIKNWVFVHGGFCPTAFEDNPYMQNGNVIHKLNNILRQYLVYPDFFENNNISSNDKVQMKILIQALYGINENKSPLNCRHYGSNVDLDTCSQEIVNKVFKYLFKNPESGKMVIAHTPQFIYNMNINSTCSDKVWRIDIGMSRAFDEHIDLIEKMIVKIGLKLINQLKELIKQDLYRYMAILKINKKKEEVITEKKFSRNIYYQKEIEKSEALFTIHRLEQLRNKIQDNILLLNDDIKYQKEEIISKINLLISFLREKHSSILKGGFNKKNIYLI